MGRLSMIRQQQNPDGIAGHREREEHQRQCQRLPPKRKFTGGLNEHHYTIMEEIRERKKKRQWDPAKLAFAREFCRDLCLVTSCTLCGNKGDERK
jgi:hypothetical protein